VPAAGDAASTGSVAAPLTVNRLSVRGMPLVMLCCALAMTTALHNLRRAGPEDLQQLIALMAEFYSDSPYTLNPRRAAEAFAPLLADDRWGYVWFILGDSQDVGYVVITLGYSMEYGGPSAVVDDFFIKPAFRGNGLGKAALAEVGGFCVACGVRAIHVETGDDNPRALAVYRRVGFVDTNRVHLTLKLAEPTHAP
jgi:GNAT superfamily N-acetyltransferase